MSRPEIRLSQIVTTFGPGSMIDLPRNSVLVGGLDHWNGGKGGKLVHEPRLAGKVRRLLDVPKIDLRMPPTKVDDPSEKKQLVRVFQFPEWFVTQDVIKTELPYYARSRRLIHQSLVSRGKWEDDNQSKHPVVPVRFVRACPKGHIGDIDWKGFIHGKKTDCTQYLWVDEVGTSGDLADVWVRCECGMKRRMSDAARWEVAALSYCNGERPWLNKYSKEDCGVPNRLLIRTASNAYFSQSMSVISIPESEDPISGVVERNWDLGLERVDAPEKIAMLRQLNPLVEKALEGFSDPQVWSEIQKRRKGMSASQLKPVKQMEVETLLQSEEELGTDVPDGDFFARALKKEVWESPHTKAIEKVVLVHRLREVVALLGFTRFEAQAPDVDGELDIDVQRAALGKETDWVPAFENRGEGVFIGFKKSEIEKWLKRPGVLNRLKKLNTGFSSWKAEHEQSAREFPGGAYVLLHSLSHMLITSMSLECGYPASSIKERIYAGSYGYGILLYTGSPDAEGTLGGLIEASRNIKEHIERVMETNLLCSNDPVCAQHDLENSNDSRFLLGAACHGCLLISETSCEQHNDFLDRELVIPTVDSKDAAFFEVNYE